MFTMKDFEALTPTIGFERYHASGHLSQTSKVHTAGSAHSVLTFASAHPFAMDHLPDPPHDSTLCSSKRREKRDIVRESCISSRSQSIGRRSLYASMLLTTDGLSAPLARRRNRQQPLRCYASFATTRCRAFAHQTLPTHTNVVDITLR